MSEEIVYILRGIERIVIEIGGITSIVMGTLLYKWGVKGREEVDAEGLGFAFKLRNAAPGTVLAFFGMSILVVGLRSPLEFSTSVTWVYRLPPSH